MFKIGDRAIFKGFLKNYPCTIIRVYPSCYVIEKDDDPLWYYVEDSQLTRINTSIR